MNKKRDLVIGIVLLIIVGLWFGFRNQLRSYMFSEIGVGTGSSDMSLEVEKLSPSEFSELISDDSVFVLDVHTPEQTHIPGTDALIPDTQIKENLNKLPEDKSTPIAVYCRSGSMSGRAAKELIELGYTNVYDLEGGTNAYKEQQVSVSLWPEKQDLGKVVYGDVETLTYTLTNYMPLPLEITRVSTSCGCTKAEVDKKELGPYESTTVNVSFDPAVHKDDTDLGELTRTIYIQTSHPDYPELEAVFDANVIKGDLNE